MRKYTILNKSLKRLRNRIISTRTRSALLNEKHIFFHHAQRFSDIHMSIPRDSYTEQGPLATNATLHIPIFLNAT